jgi:hypothetical protein
MKTTQLFLSLCISLLGFTAQAQTPDNYPWCPSGATWVYERATQTDKLYTVYQYTKDTVIQNMTAKKILNYKAHIFLPNPFTPLYHRYNSDSSFLYLRESNDSVFIYFNNVFKFMYNFSANVGDTFISGRRTPLECTFQTPNITLDDTLVVTSITPNYVVGNSTYKRFYLTSKGRWDYGPIINKIGGFFSFVPSPSQNNCFLEMGYGGLVCYSDDLRGSVPFSSTSLTQMGGMNACNYLISSLDELAEGSGQRLTVYPNPANTSITVSNLKAGEAYAYTLLDLNGRILAESTNSTLSAIDISHLQEGVYLLKVQAANHFVTLKFLKQ